MVLSAGSQLFAFDFNQNTGGKSNSIVLFHKGTTRLKA